MCFSLYGQKYVDAPAFALLHIIWRGPIVPIKSNLNAAAYDDILHNTLILILQQQFEEGPFPFWHDKARPKKK